MNCETELCGVFWVGGIEWPQKAHKDMGWDVIEYIFIENV